LIDGVAFVTPHAVARFRERIAPLDYEVARAAILDGLTRIAGAPQPARHHPGEVLVRVRRGPHAFRARLAPPMGPGMAPVVVTVFRGGR